MGQGEGWSARSEERGDAEMKQRVQEVGAGQEEEVAEVGQEQQGLWWAGHGQEVKGAAKRKWVVPKEFGQLSLDS